MVRQLQAIAPTCADGWRNTIGAVTLPHPLLERRAILPQRGTYRKSGPDSATVCKEGRRAALVFAHLDACPTQSGGARPIPQTHTDV
jgi:hypothetical protein